jgi:predicted Zn-dependent protease
MPDDLQTTQPAVSLDTSRSVRMSRRSIVKGLATGSVVAFAGPLAACTTNALTGRSQLILVSDAQLAQLGASTWQALLEQTDSKPQDSKAATELRGIGEKIVSAAGPALPKSDWEYRVFEDKQLNAFAMPGGKVGFYQGILDLMDNDSQAATVMGHEVSHIAARHSAERYSQQIASNAALTATAIALDAGDVKFRNEIAGILGVGVQFGVLLPYQRQQELEADRLGLQYMAKAGYDPRESVNFWKKMMAANAERPKQPEWLSTHPSDERRIQQLEAEIKRLETA